VLPMLLWHETTSDMYLVGSSGKMVVDLYKIYCCIGLRFSCPDWGLDLMVVDMRVTVFCCFCDYVCGERDSSYF
jgi:hypothetical protein